MSTYYIRVRGRVHKVGFRYHAKEQARALHVRGTVRNAEMNTVEIYFNAEGEGAQQFLAWCAHGPRGARVESVSVRKSADQSFDDFSIIQ